MSWKDLDIKQKAELIKLGVQYGIRDIKQIRQLYDDNNTPTQVVDQFYNETNVRPLQGIERIKQEYGIPEEEVNKANDIIQQIENEISLEEINNQQPIQFRQFKNGGYKDNPPFIQRIINNDRRSVKDWQNNDYQSTHKLSYAQTPEGYIVYPEVQEVNGQLHDFTDPKYNHGKWDALDNAVRNSDTLRFSTEKQALRYTQEYKNKYPEYFKQFNRGGLILNNPTQVYVSKVNKFGKGGYKGENEGENKNINDSILGRYVQSKIAQNNQESQEQPTIIIEEPASESTYVQQPPLNIQEQELLNYLQSNPTVEQKYFRNLAVQNMTTPQSNQGVIQTKEKEDIVDKAIQEYNNFRYSHPWAEGLNYMPIIGDGMDLISLAGDINNKNYISAGLGLGMLALPNFIQKPLYKLGITPSLLRAPKTDETIMGALYKQNNHEIKYTPTKSKIGENTINFYDATKRLEEEQQLAAKIAENNKLLDQLDEFSQKHATVKPITNADGNTVDIILTYPKADRSTVTSNRRTNKQVRDVIARHNTFARGVQMPTAPEDIERIRKIFGDDWMDKKDEVLKYVATHVRPGDGLYISPLENSSIYGNESKGSLNLVRRKYKLGKDRNKWFEEGDFVLQQNPAFSGISWDDVTDIVAPWKNPKYGTTGKIPYRESELISPKDMYWVKTVKGDSKYNLPTSFNTTFDYNRYKNGGFLFPNQAFSHKFEK